MDAVNFWVIAGGMAAVAAFGWVVGSWAYRRWRRKQSAERIVLGDTDLEIPPLLHRLADIGRQLGGLGDSVSYLNDQVAFLVADHRPNNGSSGWDGLVTVDENIRALAAHMAVELPHSRPLRERKDHR